jgi:hypothetical protein
MLSDLQTLNTVKCLLSSGWQAHCLAQFINPDSSTKDLAIFNSSHLAVKKEKHGQRNMAAEFCLQSILSRPWGSFTRRKSMTWARWLYFLSKGGHATTFITFKNPLSSARFEHANIGSSSKHTTTRPPRATYFEHIQKYIIDSKTSE